ncbi:MAG: hypothetical protein HFH47_01635 [Bacilli bacterium]|nr:hypothetical protein [Bacilli bacterium]
MEKYEIEYSILDYNRYNQRLESVLNNPNNKFEVTKHEPLGQSTCGFDIEHYSIGNGPMHIVYMGGAHGNEIIGPDFVTQMMKNLALGNGDYENFDPNTYTIDFIPCQNPEGYFTTTYALNSIMSDMDDSEIEKFSKDYWSCYRNDDINVTTMNSIIRTFCNEHELEGVKEKLVDLFWKTFRNKPITNTDVISFLIEYTKSSELEVSNFVLEKWEEKIKGDVIPAEKLHHSIFKEVNFDCIPEVDDKHRKLKASLMSLYENGDFPIGTLANFFSNAQGVNLNDNNENYFNILKNRMADEGTVYANLRDNNLSKSIPGPVGVPSANMDGEFEYAPENKALFKFLEMQDDKDMNFAFVNCHGTGGLFYLYPVSEDDMEKAKTEGVKRDFNFYINNRIASDYVSKVGEIYQKETGKYDPYRTMGHPSQVTGVGDLLRKTYLSSFILELSKMGGNPLAPYGDRQGNYNLTMEANMSASMQMMETILEMKHLYSSAYEMSYDENNRVVYNETARKL